MLQRLSRFIDVVPVAAALVLLVNLVWIWALRIGHPFDLEWMEGGMLAHSWRLQQGLGVYVEPGPDFIPFIYPPGYASVVALFGYGTGLSLALGRAVALTGALLAAAAVAVGVGRHGGSRLVGALAAVVFLGAYPASGAFYDLVRPDALYTAAVAWAVVIGLERHRHAPMAAGLVLCAGFLMKHNAAAFGVPIALGIWTRDGWRSALRFGLWAAVPGGLMTLYLQWASGGYFLIYLLEVPASHPNIWSRVMPGLPRELGAALPLAVAVPALWLVLRHVGRVRGAPLPLMVAVPVAAGVALGWYGYILGDGEDVAHFPASFAFFGLGAVGASVSIVLIGALRRVDGAVTVSWQWVYGIGVLTVGLGVAALMRAHNGGYLNVYMHLHWMVAFAFGLSLARMRREWRSPAVHVATALVLGAQLIWLTGRLDRDKLVPTSADVELGQTYVNAIAQYEGPVLSPFAAWMPVQAGKAPSLHLIALWDLNYAGGPFYDEVGRVREAMSAHYWGAVVDGTKPFGYGLQRAYVQDKAIPGEGGALAPKTGWPAYPARILVPKGRNQSGRRP